VTGAIRVVLVEDNEVYRSSLELLLGMQPGIEIVGVADTARAGEALVAELEPDVVVADFRLPDSDGVATTTALRLREPQPKVVCLTAEATQEEGDAVIRAGAAALVEKGVPIVDLAGVIRSIVTGEIV
jgi:DNA-binding NarL/FixJ family response regulator